MLCLLDCALQTCQTMAKPHLKKARGKPAPARTTEQASESEPDHQQQPAYELLIAGLERAAKRRKRLDPPAPAISAPARAEQAPPALLAPKQADAAPESEPLTPGEVSERHLSR